MASHASGEIRSGKGEDEDDGQNLELGEKYSNNVDSKAVTCKGKFLTKIQNHYGVYVPADSRADKKEYHVYTDRSEALRFLKQHKRARFKAFSSEVDAIYFTKFGCTMPSEPNKIASQKCSQSVPSHQEKSLFKAPKAQELVKFRKAIEISDLELVNKYVKENPRYLISSGDTPSILHEGTRYNALHVAARCNAAEIADYILDIIFTSELTNRSYGTQEQGYETDHRAKVLLDLYLNTPDKSASETPLHFASKAGSLAVVKVLLSYPECNREVRNKFGLTPLDLVCSRAANCLMQNKKAIIALLKERYYVPVLRCPDVTVQPVIGKPITLSDYQGSNNTEENILSPRMQVHALAGPMSEEKAQTFRKHWRTPPRGSNDNQRISRPSLFDSDKGLERIGRTLATEYRVQWTEYWEFLDAFVNLDSIEGLQMLESYLRSKVENMMALTDKDFTTIETLEENQNLLNNSCSEESLAAKQEVLSPMSELCVQFSKLSTHDVSSSSQEPLGVAFMCFQKFLEMIAKRITNALIKNSQITHEINKLQLFISSCSRDEQFDMIDLSKAHSHLSELVEKNLRTLHDVSTLKSIITSSLDMNEYNDDKPDLKRATTCVLSLILGRISLPLKNKNKTINVNSSWLQCISCDCKFKRDKRAIKAGCKRKIFDDLDGYPKSCKDKETDSERKYNKHNAEDCGQDGTDGDTESDDEFFPACSSVSSTESSDDEFTDLPNHCYDVFLAGNSPTKLDAAVLQAIESVNVTYHQYPFTYYWMKSCAERSQLLSKESWPTPCLKMKCTPIKKQLARELLSPSWHR